MTETGLLQYSCLGLLKVRMLVSMSLTVEKPFQSILKTEIKMVTSRGQFEAFQQDKSYKNAFYKTKM